MQVSMSQRRRNQGTHCVENSVCVCPFCLPPLSYHEVLPWMFLQQFSNDLGDVIDNLEAPLQCFDPQVPVCLHHSRSLGGAPN